MWCWKEDELNDKSMPWSLPVCTEVMFSIAAEMVC